LYQRRKLFLRSEIRQHIENWILDAATKTKHMNILNDGPDLRIQLSSIKPNIKRIFEDKNEKTKHSSDG
jgi:hypothetical protein